MHRVLASEAEGLGIESFSYLYVGKDQYGDIIHYIEWLMTSPSKTGDNYNCSYTVLACQCENVTEIN